MSDSHARTATSALLFIKGVLYLPNVTRYYGTGVRVALFAL